MPPKKKESELKGFREKSLFLLLVGASRKSVGSISSDLFVQSYLCFTFPALDKGRRIPDADRVSGEIFISFKVSKTRVLAIFLSLLFCGIVEESNRR